jgi:hypothetical protein
VFAVEYYLHELVCENETDLSRFLFSTMYILHQLESLLLTYDLSCLHYIDAIVIEVPVHETSNSIKQISIILNNNK